jgi:acetyl-CoA C-acetyltransferase
MENVVILGARRTAIGTFGGIFSGVSAIDLGVHTLKAVLEDTGIAPDKLDEVITGNILSANLGMNISRQIAVYAGAPVHVPAYTVNKMCGSGLKSIMLGAGAIMLEEGEIVAAGGTENMSRAPYALPSARFGARMGNTELVDLMLRDGLIDTFNNYHMGVTAENLADEWEVTREQMDEFAAESQQKAEKAMESGRFSDEIVPVPVPQKKGDPVTADTDEHPRKGVTAEGLAKLKPAFKKDGRVTAGNSSGINDGAAYVILSGEEHAEKLGKRPMARIVSWASAGVEPSFMGFGPVPATKYALEKAGWKLRDVDLIELNEAFAAQSIAVLKGWEKELGPVDRSIINVNGGAIALGHPVGASGARILVTLLYEMEKRDLHKGLATLCIGGGMGVSMCVER